MTRRSTILVALAAGGCMITPVDDARQPSTTDPFAFAGYVTNRGLTVSVQALDPSTSAFVGFATATSRTTPLSLGDAQAYFSWSTTAAVPAWAWRPVASCPTFEATVVPKLQLSGGGVFPIYTFDSDGVSCILRKVGAGLAVANAAAACGRTEPIRLVAGPRSTHAGDVTIASQADADAIRCVDRVEGNVTFAPTELAIDLPNLREVTGTVTLQMTALTTITGPHFPVVHLPELARIGRDLTATFGAAPAFSVNDLGMPKLVAVGGDVGFDFRQTDPAPAGLARLRELSGNLTIQARSSSELFLGSLLTRLEVVHGSVVIRSGSSSGSLLERLEEVGGDLTIGPTLDVLTNAVNGSPVYRNATLSALARVGGRFTIEAASGPSATRLFGAASRTAIGALRLNRTAFSAPPFPVPPNLTLAPSGGVEITDNASMCTSTIDAFVTALRSAGWTGVATISGNANGC